MITKKKILLIVTFVFLMYFVYKNRLFFTILHNESATSTENLSSVATVFKREINVSDSKIYLAVVVCGNRWEEAEVMLKSALLFTEASLHVYVFTDSQLMRSVSEKLHQMQSLSGKNLTFEILPVKFPEGKFQPQWRGLFKECSSQRLFFPSLLKNVDSVFYVDTDVIFLGPLEQIWSHFKQMNSSQLAALVPESEEPSTAWYIRFAKHPFYKPFGVNSGVMLMNLTRMRYFEWEKYLIPIYNRYKDHIPWGDQDIINIIFYFHPDKLYILTCNYNYRSDHCMYSSVCKEAEKDGIIVVHGSRNIFRTGKCPAFLSIYNAMKEYSLGSDRYKNFYLKLKTYLDSSRRTNCGKMRDSFLKNVKRYIYGTTIS